LKVNGAPETAHSFKPNPYFIELSIETLASGANQLETVVPQRTGLLFAGAYTDLHDHMPVGE
jgi:hypothetical protein